MFISFKERAIHLDHCAAHEKVAAREKRIPPLYRGVSTTICKFKLSTGSGTPVRSDATLGEAYELYYSPPLERWLHPVNLRNMERPYDMRTA